MRNNNNQQTPRTLKLDHQSVATSTHTIDMAHIVDIGAPVVVAVVAAMDEASVAFHTSAVQAHRGPNS